MLEIFTPVMEIQYNEPLNPVSKCDSGHFLQHPGLIYLDNCGAECMKKTETMCTQDPCTR